MRIVPFDDQFMMMEEWMDDFMTQRTPIWNLDGRRIAVEPA